METGKHITEQEVQWLQPPPKDPMKLKIRYSIWRFSIGSAEMKAAQTPMAERKAVKIPTVEMKLMVSMMGCSKAVSLAQRLADMMARTMEYSLVASSVETSDEETVRTMDCLSAASSAEKNMTAVSLAEKMMLD
eukprot:scaffold2273_cov72-Skeletonema_menzelii.AAC.2